MGTSTGPYGSFDNDFIGGAWREGRAGKGWEYEHPYTGETPIEIPLANHEDFDGGERMCGVGRFNGRWAFAEATEHRVFVQHARWAYPQ